MSILLCPFFYRYKCLKVYGVVIDSAPGKARFMKAAQAYALSINANPLKKCFMVLGLLLYLVWTGLVAYITKLINPQKIGHDKHYLYETMASDPTRWPMMFLFSESDKVILPCDVEEMINKRKQLGVHVDSVCWNDTDHVSHIRKHPEEYIEACEKFLCFCMGWERIEMPEAEAEELEEEDLLATTE